MRLPDHKAGLYLTHNEHKDVYETVKEWTEFSHPAYDPEFFTTPADLQKCIDTNDCWALQWYPETPVGFYKVCGSTLEIVLERAMAIDTALKEQKR